MTDMRDAAKLAQQKQHAEAIAAYVALSVGKFTDEQKAAALEQAAAVARKMKDFAQAEKLSDSISIDAVRKVARMNNLLAQRKSRELLTQFGAENIAAWPFWKQADGYLARAQAHADVGAGGQAAADLRLALELTSEPKQRAEIERLLGDKQPQK
jgi:hypothetical protein